MKPYALLPLLALIAVPSARADNNLDKLAVDGTLDIAGAPVSGFGTALGFTVGAGMDVQKDLQARVDLSYHNWSQTVGGVDLGYTRVPIAGGIRKYFEVEGQKNLRPYVQGEVELSFDSADAAVLGIKATSSSVRLGLIPAVGLDVALNNHWSVGGNLKYHIESDSYWALGLGATYHF